MSRSARRIIEFSLSEDGRLAKSTFTGALQTYKASLVSEGSLSTPCLFNYTVPRGICKSYYSSSQNKQVDMMTAPAALAVMDDLSAYAIMVVDRKFRPGVSVSLSAEILHPIYAGQHLTASFQVDKIGTYLGFQTMELRDSVTGSVLARGKHIKFMPMGWIYETLCSDKMLHRLLDLRQRYSNHPKVLSFLDNLTGSSGPAKSVIDGDVDAVGSVYKGLKVQKAEDGDYTVKLWPGMNMIMGQMHGGAAAMCVEEAATATIRNLIPTQQENSFMRSIQLTYLTGLKGNLRIRSQTLSASTLMTPDGESESTMDGGIYSAEKKDSNAYVQFTCEWMQIK